MYLNTPILIFRIAYNQILLAEKYSLWWIVKQSTTTQLIRSIFLSFLLLTSLLDSPFIERVKGPYFKMKPWNTLFLIGYQSAGHQSGSVLQTNKPGFSPKPTSTTQPECFFSTHQYSWCKFIRKELASWLFPISILNLCV